MTVKKVRKTLGEREGMKESLLPVLLEIGYGRIFFYGNLSNSYFLSQKEMYPKSIKIAIKINQSLFSQFEFNFINKNSYRNNAEKKSVFKGRKSKDCHRHELHTFMKHHCWFWVIRMITSLAKEY